MIELKELIFSFSAQIMQNSVRINTGDVPVAGQGYIIRMVVYVDDSIIT